MIGRIIFRNCINPNEVCANRAPPLFGITSCGSNIFAQFAPISNQISMSDFLETLSTIFLR